MAAGIEPPAIRDAWSRFSTGVCVITSFGEHGPSGLTANAVSSLSLRPPLMLACFDLEARTLAAVRHSRRFAIHFLAHSQEELSARFASKEPEEQKFEGVRWSERAGVPVLEGTLAWISCSLTDLVPGGDHVIAIGEAVELEVAQGEPLVFFRGDYWELCGREPAPPDVDQALEGNL